MFSPSDDAILTASLSTLTFFQKSCHKDRKYAINNGYSEFETVLESSESCEELFSALDSSYSEFMELSDNLIDSKYADTLEKINTMDRMYRELEKNWQKKEASEIEKYLTEFYADVIEPSRIRKTIENMKTVISHIQIIDEKRSKLKQVLRCDVSNDVWLIKRDYHKTVINFFNLVSEILKKIDFLKEKLENGKTFKPDTLTLIQKKELEVIQLLNENMESMERLSEFCTLESQLRSS